MAMTFSITLLVNISSWPFKSNSNHSYKNDITTNAGQGTFAGNDPRDISSKILSFLERSLLLLHVSPFSFFYTVRAYWAGLSDRVVRERKAAQIDVAPGALRRAPYSGRFVAGERDAPRPPERD